MTSAKFRRKAAAAAAATAAVTAVNPVVVLSQNLPSTIDSRRIRYSQQLFINGAGIERRLSVHLQDPEATADLSDFSLSELYSDVLDLLGNYSDRLDSVCFTPHILDLCLANLSTDYSYGRELQGRIDSIVRDVTNYRYSRLNQSNGEESHRMDAEADIAALEALVDTRLPTLEALVLLDNDDRLGIIYRPHND